MYSSLLTIRFWLSTLKYSKLQILRLIWQSILKILEFWERLVGRNGVFAHWVRIYRGHLWQAINPKVQIVSDGKFVFCSLMLRSITGKNFRKMWVGVLHRLDNLTWNYPPHSIQNHKLNRIKSSNFKKYLDLGVCSLKLVLGNLGPKELSRHKSRISSSNFHKDLVLSTVINWI